MSRRYLLDTGPTFDYLFQRLGIENRINSVRQSGAKIGICTPVLGEIVAGLEASNTRKASWDIARKRLGNLICWPYDSDAAYEYGRIFAELKRRGRPMQQVDIQIAAVAFTVGSCTVVTKDSDLSAISGLMVEDWSIAKDTLIL